MFVKPATRNELGAVKIGEGLKITEDGILTVDEEYCETYIEFTRDRLIELFEESKARGR